jgi:RNA polymerase sigma-70 factor (ECF subfamily)
MSPTALGALLGPRLAPEQRAVTRILSKQTSPARLVSSIHGRATGLFDESYLAALKERDTDAENRLVSHFSRTIQLKLRAQLRSPELIQDAFQETFLRVLSYFRSGKTLDEPNRLPAFVHATCHNIALELLRSHTRHDQLPENQPERADAGLDPESQLVTQERKALVRRLLEELSEKDRQLLRRVFLDEEDKDSVCHEFHVDRGYLRVLLYRARQRFKGLLSCDKGSKAANAKG